MSWVPTVYTVVGVAAAAISMAVAADAWRNRSEPAALSFVVLMVNLALWSFVYGIQLGFTELSTQLTWQGLTLGIAGLVPTTWLLFTVRYGGYDHLLTRPRLAILAVDPIAFFALSVTNPLHGFVWTDATFVVMGIGAVPGLTFGPGYWIHILYAYLAVGTGLVLLALVAGQAALLYRNQVGLLIGGAGPPFVSHIVYTLGIGPIPALDLTPFIFALTGILFGLAMFRFDLLLRAPVARERALEEAGDGLIVVDEAGIVVDVNRIAREAYDPPIEVGASITEVLGVDAVSDLDCTITWVGSDSTSRVYHLGVSPLLDHHDRVAGRTIVLRDVTDLHASQQRLEVANRVLRHNLRNDINVVTGYASQLEDALTGQPAEDARTIRRTAERLGELGEKARRMVRLTDRDAGDRTTVDAVAVAADVIANFRSTHGDVSFRLDGPSEAIASIVDAEALETALQNLIENAIKHNDTAAPAVSIEVVPTAEWVHVRVDDNGPGIPPMEREVIEGGMETPLRHSRGLGLWLVHWIVAESGGSLSFDVDDAGSTITMSFPRGDGGGPPRGERADVGG